MNTKLLIVFIALNVINVIIQTVKSIATVKCGKEMAAVTNAIAYGLYTVVTVYMLCDLPLMWKASIVAICNLIGVYVVKLAEEKAREDKLWKIEATIATHLTDKMAQECKYFGLSSNYIQTGKHTIFNFYCSTKKDSAKVKELLKLYNAKYFVSETKIL